MEKSSHDNSVSHSHILTITTPFPDEINPTLEAISTYTCKKFPGKNFTPRKLYSEMGRSGKLSKKKPLGARGMELKSNNKILNTPGRRGCEIWKYVNEGLSVWCGVARRFDRFGFDPFRSSVYGPRPGGELGRRSRLDGGWWVNGTRRRSKRRGER